MKSLIKLAVGAAIAGALVKLLLKQRSRAISEEVTSLDERVGLRGDRFVEGLKETDIPTVTPVEEGREDWYGAETSDSPRH